MNGGEEAFVHVDVDIYLPYRIFSARKRSSQQIRKSR